MTSETPAADPQPGGRGAGCRDARHAAHCIGWPGRMPPRPPLPDAIESHRDHHWRRDPSRAVGFGPRRRALRRGGGFRRLPDRRPPPGPVALRRRLWTPRRGDAAQRPEGSRGLGAWRLKDELMRRGKVYYAKLARGKAMFLAPRVDPLLPRGLGRAQGGGAQPSQPRRPAASCGCCGPSGRWRRPTCGPTPDDPTAWPSAAPWTSSRRRCS